MKETPTNITHKMLEEQARKIGQLAADVSIALNEIQDIKHHLHSNRDTNTVGTVERSVGNEKRISDLEQREKIYIAKAGLLYSIGIGLGSAIIWVVMKFINREIL